MGKLKTKEQVVADFKHNIVPQIIEALGKKDFDTLNHCWGVNLDELYKNKEISESQKQVWTMPKEMCD